MKNYKVTIVTIFEGHKTKLTILAQAMNCVEAILKAVNGMSRQEILEIGVVENGS